MDENFPTTSSTSEEPVISEWSQKYFGHEEPIVRIGMLRWWYRLTAPENVPLHAGFARRETVRRGHLASTILFFFPMVLLGLALPVGILTHNPTIILVVSLLLIVIVIAIAFNRKGKSNIAGLLIASALTAGLYTVILKSPGGLATTSLSLFDLLVFSELFIASLLPVNWVFLAAFINSIFITATLLLMPHTSDLHEAMQTMAYPIILRPIALHLIVSLVLWLWVRSALNAIKRADRAEVIAALQHSIAEQEHVIAQQKRMLDISVKQIIQIHTKVANGDFAARVFLPEDAPLWPVGISLNNLLNRVQRLRRTEQEFQQMLPRFHSGNQAEYELQRAKQELELLLKIVREAYQANRSIRALRGGSLLDPLIGEISGKYLSPLPPPLHNTPHLQPLYMDNCSPTLRHVDQERKKK